MMYAPACAVSRMRSEADRSGSGQARRRGAWRTICRIVYVPACVSGDLAARVGLLEADLSCCVCRGMRVRWFGSVCGLVWG